MKLHDLKNVFFFCFLFSIVSLQNVNGQNFLFKVIAISGKPSLSKPPSGNWLILKTGDKISSGYKLKLEAGDYLGLISNKGRSLEIKLAGTFSSDELFNNIPKGSSNLSKFADFVMNESAANKKKSENMKNLGAVVRARAGLIESGFPDNTDLINLQLDPVWYSAGTGTNYTFKILNPLGRTVFVKETKDTSLTIDLKQFGLLADQNYFWCVVNSLNPEINSDTSTFRILSDDNIKTVSDSLKMIKDNLDANSAIGQFLIVKFLESKDLNCEALDAYETLIKSNPLIEDYSANYLLFLTKQGLSKKAEILLSTMKK